MNTQAAPAITMLDPSRILIGDNVRFGLKGFAMDSLVASIEAQGEVEQPIEVEALATPEDGKTHKLTVGERRLTAVLKLNERGAGLKIPAIVKPAGNDVERTKRQLRENLERESMSPMDKAVAIKRLLDLKVSKEEIRQTFAEPGGRKGLKMAPLSNSYVNMLVSFLTLPKKLSIKVRGENRSVNIQEMIHDGRLTVGAGYELTKLMDKPDKFLTTVENLEEMRQKSIDEEEKEENRFLTGSKKEEEKAEKAAELETSHATAKAVFDEAKKVAEAKATAAAEAFKATQLKPESAKNRTEAAAAIKKAAETFKAAQEDSKVASKALDKAKTDFDRLDGKLQSVRQNAEDKAKKLANAKAKQAPANAEAATKGKGKTQGAGDVKNASAGAEFTPPNASQIRKEIEELCLPGVPAKVQAIGEVFKAYVTGITTPNLLIKSLAKLTGETWKGPARKEK